MQLVDSHVHFWRIGQCGHAWPGPDLPEIHGDFVESDLAAASAGLGVSGVILVQSQPNDEDTDWLLSLAASSPRVLGVVGWVDLAAPDAVARLEALAERPKVCGVRPMLQAIAEDGWINRPRLAPAVQAMERLGLAFDALVQPRHLPHLIRFADAHPALRIVVDHCAKPLIAAGLRQPWLDGMAELARRPNVFCKLSGLSTECASSQAVSAAVPYIRDVLSVFPPERLLWGSDWPVVNMKSDYRAWLSLCVDATFEVDEAGRARIFGGSAEEAYRLRALTQGSAKAEPSLAS